MLALPGCEDGPSQTFSVAPANAGNLWNNGNPAPSVADGAAPFDAGFGSINALAHCTADKQRTTWANMLEQPLIPPLQYAGLNLAYDQRFDGITLKEAEAINCTGNPIGGAGVSWGDNGEVVFFYTSSNYIVNQIDINLGYSGKMTFHQAVGTKNAAGDCAVVSRFEDSPTADPDPTHCAGHTYVIQLGQPILKDGVVFEIDYQDQGPSTAVNELFNGMMATFGQGSIGWSATADYDPQDCTNDGSCLVFGPNDAAGDGGQCFIGYLPLAGIGIATNCTTSIQPTISIPINISQNYYLTEPYSYESSVAQISSQGPTSLPRFNIPADPQNCFVQIGMQWSDYIKDCVDVPGGTGVDTSVLDAGLVPPLDGGMAATSCPFPCINAVNEGKALAAHTHDNETYQFNVVGVGLNWTDTTVEQSPTAIVQDNDVPSITDPLQAIVNFWGTNLYDKGTPINDTAGAAYTAKGSSYVYREWARLVQTDVNKILTAAHPGSTIYNHEIGDPACFVSPKAASAAGCTGLEGLIFQTATPTSSNPSPTYGDPTDNCLMQGSGAPANICANYQAYLTGDFYAFNSPGYGATVLRPGGVLSIFCQNPPGVAPFGTQSSTDPLNGSCNIYQLWPGALAQVQAIAGLGNLNALPTEIADVRYYYRWYGIALIKYLKAYGANPNALASDIAAQTLDLESVFFDSFNNGGGGFNDTVEYVERSFMQNSPTTYVGNGTGSAGTAGAVTVPASVNSFPTDFNINSIILAGDEQGSSWTKFLYRPERAVFTAMLENKADLPGKENNVNLTNLGGSPLLQQNYANYQCATQWPNVVIPGIDGDPAISGSWADICQDACIAGPSNTLPCPRPPLLPPDAMGNQALQLDLNGSNPGLGLATTNPRLAGYKGAWGPGTGCPASGGAPAYTVNPTNSKSNPYNSNGCSTDVFILPVATGVGSVFSVGQKPAATKRLSFVGATAANPKIGTNADTLTAYVNIPNLADPYNAYVAGAAPPAIQVTAPWVDAYDGIGFFIPVNGQLDKFYATQQIDFTGYLLSYVVDVVPWQDPITQATDGTLTIEAIEGTDFLGEVFLCQDLGSFPTPGSGDLLGARMYDSAGGILQWISNHPGSEDSCNIIVRYSVYDNYVDFITSLTYGVQVDINQGGGYGRVVGGVIFDPNLSSAP